MLTEEDDAIRAIDIPERMQLASESLPALPPTENGPAPYIPEEDLDEATAWMASRVSPRCTEDFLMKDLDGNFPRLHDEYLEAIKSAIRFLNVNFLEVPFIWHHRSDFLVHFDANATDPSVRNIAFLNQADLWRISALSVKYRALAHRRTELRTLFDQLDVEDDYFEDIFSALESVEEVADANDWLAMKYLAKLAEVKSMKEVDEDGPARVKRATRESLYDKAKRNLVSKLAEVSLDAGAIFPTHGLTRLLDSYQLVGISATELAQDFVTLNKTHFADDPPLAPLTLAEEYCGSGEYATPESALAGNRNAVSHLDFLSLQIILTRSCQNDPRARD